MIGAGRAAQLPPRIHREPVSTATQLAQFMASGLGLSDVAAITPTQVLPAAAAASAAASASAAAVPDMRDAQLLRLDTPALGTSRLRAAPARDVLALLVVCWITVLATGSWNLLLRCVWSV